MDKLFGLSMDSIMLGLVAGFLVSLAAVAYVVLRNRIMFKMGVRNIPRRMAQTVLIVIGLMLSTLIISAALTTGDTVDRSVTNFAYELSGHVDEIVAFDVEKTGASAAEPFVPESTLTELEAHLGNDPDIDGIAPVIFEPVPAINPRTGLSTPSAFLTGMDPERMAGFPDIVSRGGKVLDVGALAPDEIYLNETAQEELDAQPGDTLQIFIANVPHAFRVIDIVRDTAATGAIGGHEAEPRDGMVTRLDVVQQLFYREGQLDFIGISNRGGVRDGMALSDTVAEKVEAALTNPNLSVQKMKQDSVQMAELMGNVMTTMFLVMGLFSIAAGILLIFMIFVMLAAERKPEMGMARAVGSKRSQLVQAFLSEGMAYNLGAALVGAGLGVLVAIGMARVMASLFAQMDINITPYVTPRSLIISYCLGVVVTFITVVISSWRVSRLNIVAAIRDLPETSPFNPEQGTWKGYLRGVLNAFVAVGFILVSLIGALTFSGLWRLFLLVANIGLVGPWLYLLRDQSFSAPARQRSHDRPMAWFWPLWFPIPILAFPFYQIALLVARRERVTTWPLMWTPFVIPYLAALILVRLARDRRPRSVPNWLILLGLLVPPLGLVMVALQDRDRPIAWSAGFGTVGILFGAFLGWVGIASGLLAPFTIGVSIALLSLIPVMRYFALPERPVFTIVGLAVLTFWALPSGTLDRILPEMDANIEMFFLSGIFMVAAATFVIVYNADILLHLLERAGGSLGHLLPALRIAVAYPLANKFRTGMTLAMIALVVFAVVMMSIMNTNFNALFLRDDSRGGWDIMVTENPNNPIGDLVASLNKEGSVNTDQLAAVGAVRLPDLFVSSELRQVGASEEWGSYPVLGVDDAFARDSQIRFQTRARQYPDDKAVWEAIRTTPGLAVIDAFAVSTGGFSVGGPEFHIRGLDETAKVMDPLTLELRDPASKKTVELSLIGVIDFGPSANFPGLYTSEQTFNDVFGKPDSSVFYVKVRPGVDPSDMAKAIESALVTSGAQAVSIKDEMEKQQATSNSFFYLIQGFMGMGLLVGTAAVGVIAFRSVVERRRQIGMLRAIGYTRGSVALSFIMESSFIALMGIATGVGLAMLLAFNLLHSDEFSNIDMGFIIPWQQILLISAFAYGASFLMTILPSRQAAGITIAEALRYE